MPPAPEPITNSEGSSMIPAADVDEQLAIMESIVREKSTMTPDSAGANLSELLAVLSSRNSSTSDLSPELARRVRDVQWAQRQRLGRRPPWGVYGLTVYLDDVRADLEWAEDAAFRRQHGQPYLSWADFIASRQACVKPRLTQAVVILCTIGMIVELAVNPGFEPLRVNPLLGPSAETLIRLGARDTAKIVLEHQWYRLVTPILLHAGLVHYAINMLAYGWMGAAVEVAHGWKTALVMLLVPGVGGNILSALFLPQYISVGASGAIFGLVGACLVDIVQNWNLLFLDLASDESGDDETSRRQPARRNIVALIWLVVDVAINILLGFTPFIDNFTHLGGILYGILCATTFIPPLSVSFLGVDRNRISLARGAGGIISGVALVGTALYLGTAAFAGMDTTAEIRQHVPCRVCQYLSCAPLPLHRDPADRWWNCDSCETATAAELFGEITDASGASTFQRIELDCPSSGDSVEIDLSPPLGADAVQDQLPSFCRTYC